MCQLQRLVNISIPALQKERQIREKLGNRYFLARKLNFIFHANPASEKNFSRKIVAQFRHHIQGTATPQRDDALLTIGR
jgi:hypothetical protein